MSELAQFRVTCKGCGYGFFVKLKTGTGKYTQPCQLCGGTDYEMGAVVSYHRERPFDKLPESTKKKIVE